MKQPHVSIVREGSMPGRATGAGVQRSAQLPLVSLRPRAAVVIEPISADTPQNGNICDHGRRLSAISTLTSANWESEDETKCARSWDLRPILRSLGKPGRRQECVAGVLGYLSNSVHSTSARDSSDF